MSTERLKTGARRFRGLAERWARRVFRPTESGVPKPSMSEGRQDEPELILTGLRLQLLIGLRVHEDEFFVVESWIGPESETTGIFSLDLD
jgi:hypothetical protein